MRHRKYAGLAFLLVLLSLGLAYAQYPQYLAPETPVRPTPISDQDREFVSKAVRAGIADVALGKLAITKSANTVVKQYGKYVVNTHGHTNAALTTMAKAKGIAIPKDSDTQYQELGALLRTVEGTEFDRLYIYGAALSSQIATAALFEEQAINGRDPDLRDFAKRTLSSIKKNIEIIRMISAQESLPQRTKRAAIYI